MTAVAALFTNCDPNYATGGGVSTVNMSSISPPLQVPQPSVTIGSFQTFQISPTGGVPPYHYQLQTGSGSVEFNSGLYEAGGMSCTCSVLVTDSSGKTTTVTINVIGPTTSASPTPTPTVAANVTNCSAMLNALHTAAQDTTSNGVGSAIGATNLTDPSACASWCGSQMASYCMWSPGTDGTFAGNPVCIAWPAGVQLNVYQTTWSAYSGSCQ